MTKKIYFKLAVFLVAINILFMPNIIATANTQNENIRMINNVNTVENDDSNLTPEELKQKEELNNIIKELIKSIKNKIITVDEKIESIRKIEEYETYPAIRLNVDTPIFGLDSIINSKLKIKQEVSATDIAKSYSIRYIIKNNSIKIPDKYIAGIIVSTKDIKFDDKISLTDANTAVIRLMQYSKTVDNVIEFLDNQTNKIFKGYINKYKSESINEVKRKLDKLNSDLLLQDEKLLYLHIASTSDESKTSYYAQIEKFNNISKKVKEVENKAKNILITDEELVKVQKEVLELESTMINYSSEIDKVIENVNKNLNEKDILVALQKELNGRNEVLNKIVDNSVIKKEVENTDENTENIEQTDEEKTIEEIKKYEVVSENILSEIEEKILKVLDEKVKKYTITKVENEQNKNEVKITEEEKQQIVQDCINLYKEFITKENKFYLDNINNTLENTTSKISDLSKYTKSDVLNEMRYIYLELPLSLENYLDSSNLNRVVETRTLSNNFNIELNKLLEVYIKVDNIYDELNVDEIKSRD